MTIRVGRLIFDQGLQPNTRRSRYGSPKRRHHLAVTKMVAELPIFVRLPCRKRVQALGSGATAATNPPNGRFLLEDREGRRLHTDAAQCGGRNGGVDMMELTESQLLELVLKTTVAEGNPRVRAITNHIVTDLFRTIREFDVSAEEFWAAVQWITRVGETGQFGLITAGLGFDRLLDIRQDEMDRKSGRLAGTPRAIEGPLYVAGAPLSEGEALLDSGTPRGEVLVMEGQVLDTEGKPVVDAIVDVWHANENGRYSHFDPDQPQYNLRRRIAADAQGRYRFRSFLPPGYAIPPNSPTSELFAALGRRGKRPAHIHFLVSAPGMRALTTQVNIPGDPFLDDDFAFATRDALIVDLEKNTPATGYESLGIHAPFTRVRFNFVLQKAANQREVAGLSRHARALS
jgi:catechol 1,2-dioxygenase